MVYGGVGGKVHPRGKSFALRPESGSFDKTLSGKGFSLTWFNPWLRTIQMVGVFGPKWLYILVPKIGIEC